MPNILRHRFVSTKADGPDPSQIQPSYWNDGHNFTGGNGGDVLTRDPTDANYGAVWTSPVAPYWVGTGAPAAVLSLPPSVSMYTILCSKASPATIHGAAPSSGALIVGARLRILNVGGS